MKKRGETRGGGVGAAATLAAAAGSRSGRVGAEAASGASATAGRGRVLVCGHERAVMHRQRTELGEQNGCWAPPVVAMATFYGLHQSTSTSARNAHSPNPIEAGISFVGVRSSTIDVESSEWNTPLQPPELTVASVLALRPFDEGESACDVLEEVRVPSSSSSPFFLHLHLLPIFTFSHVHLHVHVHVHLLFLYSPLIFLSSSHSLPCISIFILSFSSSFPRLSSISSPFYHLL
jgi:hypothetical protein